MTGPVIMRAMCFANGAHCPFSGKFLRAFDVDVDNGIGWADYTEDPAQALHFETAADAMAAWRTQSTMRPLRPDGRPNCPLTCTSFEIMEAP